MTNIVLDVGKQDEYTKIEFYVLKSFICYLKKLKFLDDKHI